MPACVWKGVAGWRGGGEAGACVSACVCPISISSIFLARSPIIARLLPPVKFLIERQTSSPLVKNLTPTHRRFKAAVL